MCVSIPFLYLLRTQLTPCRALSSLYALATSLNFCPSLSFPSASIALECFSQRMCLTFTAVPAPDFLPLPPPPLAESEPSAPSSFASIIHFLQPEMLQQLIQLTTLSSFACFSPSSFAGTPTTTSTLSLGHLIAYGAAYLE